MRATESYEDLFDMGFVLIQLKEEVRSFERLLPGLIWWYE